MKKIVLSISVMFIVLSAMAQSASLAESYYNNANYAQAQTEYGKLVHRYPTNALYNHRYARCAWEQGDLETALKHFLKSGDRYVLTSFYLGEVYAKMWYTDEAIAAYRQYLDKSSNQDFGDYVRTQIERLEMMRRYLKRVQQVELLGVTTYRKDSFLNAYAPYSDIGQLLQDSVGNCAFINARQDRRVYTVTDSVSHLVEQYQLLDSWSEPDTLPETIHFVPHLNYPFLMTDGVTLYFAAQDPEGFGGYDLYVTRYNAAIEQYTTPENLGLPFNSEKNDYMFFVDENRHMGLFATDRFTTDDSVAVYTFVYDDNKQYIHTDNTDTLVAYATLRLPSPLPQSPQPITPNPRTPTSQPIAQDAQPDSFFFILNDSTVYTQPEHFLNDSAKEAYLLCLEREEELHRLNAELETLRRRYMVANEDERKQLAPSILQKENRQGQCIREIDTLLNRARSIEQREY